MWVLYLIWLPLTLGMVILTARYFAGPEVPRYVFFTVGYTWFCSLSIIILVPADIYTVTSFLFLLFFLPIFIELCFNFICIFNPSCFFGLLIKKQ